jgi:hypothetical protein
MEEKVKQSGSISAKTGTKKVTIKLPEIMPSDKYVIALAIAEPVDYDKEIALDVPFETKEEHQFVVNINKKLPYKIVLQWTVEMLS